MLLRKEKILFIHIPRTGGSSIEQYFFNFYNIKPSIFNFTSGYTIHKVSLSHAPYPLVKNSWLDSKETLDEEWTQFSIVRNPYDKVMSELLFWPNLGVTKDFQTHKDLKWRQEKILNALSAFITNSHGWSKTWAWDNHLHSQNFFLQEIPKNFKIFKFEEGITNIMDRLGFENFKHDNERHQDIKKRHNLEDVNYEELRTPEFIETINEHYKKDFERFGYEML